MLATILILNVLFIGFLILTGSPKNIESRTEREEKILRGEED
jgi:hypothetical protein